jgi:hypothetical protein
MSPDAQSRNDTPGQGARLHRHGPDFGSLAMRPRTGLHLAVRSRGAFDEHRNEDGLSVSAACEAEAGSAGEQPVKGIAGWRLTSMNREPI